MSEREIVELRELTQRMVRLCAVREKKPLNPLRASRASIAHESAMEAVRVLLLPIAEEIDARVAALQDQT